MFDIIGDVWQSLKKHDAPNWFSMAVSIVLWPAVLYWWFSRKIQSVPHLELQLHSTSTRINGIDYNAVGLSFVNRTGAIVYLYNARLRERQKFFPIPLSPVRDIGGSWRELKFINHNSALVDHERVIHTGDTAQTSIAISKPMNEEFYSHRPIWLCRLLSRPKFFVLEYTAVVGDRKYSVKTIY